MSLDLLPEVNELHFIIGGAVLVILALVLALIRGVVRILLMLVGLVPAMFTFWFVLKKSDTLISKIIEGTSPWIPFAVAGISGIIIYVIVSYGLGFIFKPLLKTLDGIKRKKLVAGLLGLILGGLWLYGGANVSHQYDAMVMLDRLKDGEESSWVNQSLAKFQESKAGIILEKLDPTKSGKKADLVKLLALTKYGKINTLNSEVQAINIRPEIKGLLSDPKISKALDEGDFLTLFNDERLSEFLKKDEHLELLDRIDWRAIVEALKSA